MKLEDYNWSTTCFICGAKKEKKEDMILISSVIPLEKCPDHAEPEYVHIYPACTDCFNKKELA